MNGVGLPEDFDLQATRSSLSARWQDFGPLPKSDVLRHDKRLTGLFVSNPERSKIRSRVGERALGRDLMRVLLRIITAYGERRPAELLLRFGRQGPVFIPDRTLTLLIGRQ